MPKVNKPYNPIDYDNLILKCLHENGYFNLDDKVKETLRSINESIIKNYYNKKGYCYSEIKRDIYNELQRKLRDKIHELSKGEGWVDCFINHELLTFFDEAIRGMKVSSKEIVCNEKRVRRMDSLARILSVPSYITACISVSFLNYTDLEKEEIYDCDLYISSNTPKPGFNEEKLKKIIIGKLKSLRIFINEYCNHYKDTNFIKKKLIDATSSILYNYLKIIGKKYNSNGCIPYKRIENDIVKIADFYRNSGFSKHEKFTLMEKNLHLFFQRDQKNKT